MDGGRTVAVGERADLVAELLRVVGLKESTAALRSRLPLAVPALFELFVKANGRNRCRTGSCPISSNSSSGGLISGVATVSSRCATRAVLPRVSSSTGWCGFGRCKERSWSSAASTRGDCGGLIVDRRDHP